MKTKVSYLKALNIIAFVAMITINVLADLLPLGGLTTAQISKLYPSLLTPIGLTFSVWGVIYALLLWMLVADTIKEGSVTKEMRFAFAISCALNIMWLIFWHYQLMLFATLSIIALMGFVIVLNAGTSKENAVAKVAFSIYEAWITVASAISLYIYLAVKFPVFHVRGVAVTISAMALLALTTNAIIRTMRTRTMTYGLTTLWAMLGILLNHVGEGYFGLYPELIVCTFLGMAALLVALITAVFNESGTRSKRGATGM